TDLRYPGEWYPAARSMQRKIIMHVGPTNSGKTYNALKRLEECDSGVYCGPLRLLALEIFERMNKKGKQCNLVTGEEQRIICDEAPLISSTVEMVNLKKRVKVAVVDEIQMIADKDRGWAWTQAVLGLQAEEIHLCGEPSIVPLVSEICANLNEEVEVRKYDRLSSLKILSHSLNSSFKNIRKGDCVVTFSRKNIFAVKKAIEQETKLKCAVIYGSLPPETRSEQAKLFNDANSGYDVLVASDAIGMGLNLNIRRVVFETLLKFNGIAMRPVSLSQIKQIAGRAGRFGTAYDVGEVTTLDHFDLKILHRAMKTSLPTVQHAGLQANVNVVEMFAYQFPDDSFSSLLSKFEDLAKVDGRYFLCNFNNQKRIADLIDELPMSIQERYQFVTAPANIKDPVVSKSLLQFATDFSDGAISPLDMHINLPSKAPKSMAELKNLEAYHRVILLYMWLSYRFPDIFNSSDSARQLKTTCEGLINESLRNMHFARKAPPRHKKENDILGFNETFPTKDLLFDRSTDPNLIPVSPADKMK
ncbi:P-loop containing nucleoside triphosphate hydrolase protein, partial [Basidiobolus meristosporus CBS 931.73]